jgi:hypothetical protein
MNKKDKLIIISSNKRNKVLQTIEDDENLKQFQFLHYVTPGAGIVQLVKHLEDEARQLTHSDHCVLMIGEHDFRKSEDYIEIIKYIRNSLSKINNTNIILCTPTYICGYDLYNCRVELFNSLLCLDVNTHNHAHLFDSNLTLSLEMFSLYNGRLNNLGMQDIVKGIGNLLLSVRNTNDSDLTLPKSLDTFNLIEKSESDITFFRPDTNH